VWDAVSPGDLAALGPVSADDSRQRRIPASMRECWNDRDLRDVAQTDDGVSNPASRWH
jgi:hypothetical protein